MVPKCDGRATSTRVRLRAPGSHARHVRQGRHGDRSGHVGGATSSPTPAHSRQPRAGKRSLRSSFAARAVKPKHPCGERYGHQLAQPLIRLASPLAALRLEPRSFANSLARARNLLEPRGRRTAAQTPHAICVRALRGSPPQHSTARQWRTNKGLRTVEPPPHGEDNHRTSAHRYRAAAAASAVVARTMAAYRTGGGRRHIPLTAKPRLAPIAQGGRGVLRRKQGLRPY